MVVSLDNSFDVCCFSWQNSTADMCVLFVGVFYYFVPLPFLRGSVQGAVLLVCLRFEVEFSSVTLTFDGPRMILLFFF